MQELKDTMVDAVSTLKALADRNRLRIVKALAVHGELCACQFAGMLGISAATVSRHMGILLAAKLVAGRKDGRWMHYSLEPSGASRERILDWVRDGLSGDAQAEADLEYLDTAPPVGDSTACAENCGL